MYDLLNFEFQNL